MARTPSNTDLPLGTVCPPFELPCVLCEKTIGLDDVFFRTADVLERKGLLVAFLSVHCPFVQHMERAFTALAQRYRGEIATVAICSNDAEAFPEDAPERMREQGLRLGWAGAGVCGIPYLVDSEQDAAHAFHAACTPDLYLFNADRELVYHAQFDRTRPYRQSDANHGVEKVPQIHTDAHGADLEAAIRALLAGEAPLTTQVPSLGCNIKWK